MIGWIFLVIIYYIGFFISFFIGTNQQREIDESNYKRMIKECYISKNKVKDKIEEVSNGTYDAKIVLQSLLEKE